MIGQYEISLASNAKAIAHVSTSLFRLALGVFKGVEVTFGMGSVDWAPMFNNSDIRALSSGNVSTSKELQLKMISKQ